jgi:two-component system, NarL family, nitrate/nitrite response regulator NarL
MADRPVEVIVIDDHPVVGDGLVLVLGYEGITCRPVSPASPEQAIEEALSCGATLALLDLDLGWVGATGLDLIAPLRAHGIRAVVYSATRDRRMLGLALEAGALGAVTKGQGIDDLVDALVRAREGEAVNSPRERVELVDELHQFRARQRERMAPCEALTAREAAVLQGLVDGDSAEAIATSSFVALSTVRSQIKSILAKLDVTSQIGAVALARRARWSAGGSDDGADAVDPLATRAG